MNPNDIKVGERFRKDLGSIDDLVVSIREVGLIQPLIVDDDGNLIAGQRRLAACQLLTMEDVPVVVVTGLEDAAVRVQAERDENWNGRRRGSAAELGSVPACVAELVVQEYNVGRRRADRKLKPFRA